MIKYALARILPSNPYIYTLQNKWCQFQTIKSQKRMHEIANRSDRDKSQI